jgi:ankyrin repeat protein
MLMGVLEGVGHRGKTQLQRAIEGGDSIRTRDLIALGADVNWIDRRDESVLLSAVYSGDVGMVRLVLDGRAQVDLGNDSSGVTPLELAASRGHHDIVKTLLEAGAKHGRALECAAWQGHAAVMTQLYELGCTQLPTLHAPARENHPAAVELLLKWKADVNARDHRGWTPLMCAASQGHVWIVRGLLAAKADVNAQTRRLETALNQAEEDSHDAVVKLLRGVGATDNHYKANKHKAKVMSVLTLVARHYGNAHP